MPKLPRGDPRITLTPTDIFALMYEMANFNKNRTMRVKDYALGLTIVLRESGGDSGAFRPENLNPDGGEDRGMWQLNSKWQPNATDEICYHPIKATSYVAQITTVSDWRNPGSMLPQIATFKNWEAWNTSGSTTVATPQAMALALIWDNIPAGNKQNAVEKMHRNLKKKGFKQIKLEPGAEVRPFPAFPDFNLPDPLGDIDDFFIGLGKRLFNVGFWKALGLGALGFFIIVISVMVFNKDTITSTVGAIK